MYERDVTKDRLPSREKLQNTSTGVNKISLRSLVV